MRRLRDTVKIERIRCRKNRKVDEEECDEREHRISLKTGELNKILYFTDLGAEVVGIINP